ncbi:MAG: TolC family protein [Terracidiphilus sp.]|nr:TolC family protein [Terracidiphilus sp.]
MKHLYAVVLLAMTLPLVTQGQAQPAPVPGPASAPLTVDEAVAEARQGNPAIRAAVRRLSLAQMKISTARSLDDPMFQVRDWGTPLSKPWDLNQAQVMLMVQQTFPSRLKRDMRAKVAGDDAAVAAEELEALRQQVDADVRKACADLKRNAVEMKLHDRQSDLLKEAVAAALAQYTTGKVPQADVLRAQMALTRLSEHLIELEEERDTARSALNALLGRRADDAIEITGAYAPAAPLPPLEDLERMALEHRPELASLRKQIATSHDQSQLTRLAMKPDFTVGAGYMLMPTGSMARNAYMAEVGMNLPWLNRERHDGEAKQADAATEVTRAELEARTTVVFSEIRQAQIAVQAAEKRTKLYRDTLLPQAEATFKASTAAYQNNRAEFQMLIDSQNLLLDIQTAFYKASAATDAGLAQLQRAVGAPLPTDERTSK